jgi:proline racemase
MSIPQAASEMLRIPVIDSHTGGEPTRVVLGGMPDFGSGSMEERRRIFSEQYDSFRRAVVNEPRGSDVLVGALLLEPCDPECAAGVVFFNNVGMLGMCGHGLIGMVATLAHMGRIKPGVHRIETPVGEVSATLHDDGRVSVANVPCHRKASGVRVEPAGYGPVIGDVAWGGNWFFLAEAGGRAIDVAHAPELLAYTEAIRKAVNEAGFPEVDHVELFSPPLDPANHSRNFVLCPGGAYDRSSCGTGTSAKMACLAAAGKLAPDTPWRQESITGSVFEGRYQPGTDGQVLPVITGQAWITAEATLLLDRADPFQYGIPSSHS